MGRKNKSYSISLTKQIYNEFLSMQAFGDSKKTDRITGTDKDKIYSFDTFHTYYKHCKYFARYIKQTHPDCTTLRAAKKYVSEFLAFRSEQKNKDGRYLSAWTIQTEAAALNKLFRIDKADTDRFQPPKRRREDIIRSRRETQKDRHFSVSKNKELIDFCCGTGCRRNVLEKLKGRDLWTREQMEEKVRQIACYNPVGRDRDDLQALKDALTVFSEEKYFLYHRNDKGGKSRYAPIIGPHAAGIVARMRSKRPDENVWQQVSSGADVHGYRAEYATAVYRKYARDIKDIPYDRVNKGTGYAYQGDVYTCRKDRDGRKFDRKAMLVCSKALGHNRVDVVAKHYLRGI